jgi:hypothetical protein
MRPAVPVVGIVPFASLPGQQRKNTSKGGLFQAIPVQALDLALEPGQTLGEPRRGNRS